MHCLYSLIYQASAIYGFFHKFGLIALSYEVSFIICNLIVCVKTEGFIPFFC